MSTGSTNTRSLLVSEPKRKKSNSKNDSHDQRSRSLNDFHDAILKHILSFIPTKFAVRTSVLSKRWEYMWTSLPSLDFREYPSYGEHASTKRKHFMDFVDRALILHNLTSIRKFSLKCHVMDDWYRIKTWISGLVIRSNVQEFNFIFYCDRHENVLPLCLFNNETMEVLKLQTHSRVQLPSQICLPRLKILTLENITFKEYHPTNLLFDGPALEQLFITYCTWEGENNKIIISASKLWTLSIVERDRDRTDEEWPYELDSNNFITISAPQLQIFNYKGPFLKDYRFPCPLSITEANLQVFSCLDSSDLGLDEVLRWLQLVKSLRLSSPFFKAIFHSTVPIFKNLILLEVYNGKAELSYKVLDAIDNKCPRIETLRFHEGIYFCRKTCNLDRVFSSKFKCLPSTLKEITIQDFSGEIKEISFIRMALAQLTSLEIVKIVFMQILIMEQDDAGREEIVTILSQLPRGSKSCKLITSQPKWLGS